MIISSVTNALIYKTGQPGKEAAPVTQAFRPTTAGAGHFREWKMSRRRNGRKLLKCGQSYEIKEGVLL